MTRLWLLLCLLLGTAAMADAQSPPLVIILLPETSLQGWRAADAPHLHRLMATGALAVMNTRTARLPDDHSRETPESAALTLGAGARAAGDAEATDFSPSSAAVAALTASAGDLFARRTGKRPPPGHSVNIYWPTTLRASARLGYRLELGNLADALAAKGVPLSAGGGRFATCVATTSDGMVKRAASLTAATGHCLIWDAGSDIPAADVLLESASAQVARLHGRLVVLSPFAGDRDYARGHRLTPALEWGEGVAPGLLRSPSTHRTGLVVNTDFAPTVGAFFGVKREGFPVRPFGEVWNAVAAPDAEQQTFALEGQAVGQRQGMKILPYLAVALAVWMLGGTALALGKRLPPLVAVVPLILLVALVFTATLPSLFLWFGLLLAPVWALTGRLGARRAALVLMAVLAATLVGDMATGSRLMQRGLLGYSAIEGARYYGIGNEAMGALVGALLVLAARLWRPFGRARWTLLLLLGTVALLLGSASAGAKAGGLLVSLAAFGTLGFALLGGRWSVRSALVLGAGTIAAMTLAAVGDAVGGHGAHSHMGEAVRRIQTGGWSEAGDILTRKLAVEARLAYHSAWACVFWGGGGCLAVLWKKQGARALNEEALRLAGLVGIAASITLNDAGIIAGALCLIPLWCDSLAGLTKTNPLQQTRPLQGVDLSREDY